MKFSCQGTELSKALRIVGAAVQSRNTIPVLSCVLLEAAGDQVTVTATDLTMRVSAQVPASVIEGGSALVEASVARGLVRAGHAAFELDGDALVFRGASSSARLTTQPVEDFPIAGKDSGFEPIKSSIEDVLECMKFASDEEARYYLRGVCIDADHCVGTDGHRILAIEGGGGSRQIIPKDAAALLSQMKDAQVSLSNHAWRAENDTVVATGQLIDGNFPDWQRIMPAIDATATMQADELASAASAIAPVFSEKVRAMGIQVQDGRISLSAQGGFGKGEATAPASGDMDRVGINGKYLESACAAFSGQEVSLASGRDVFLMSANGRRAVVMGMRA